MVKTYLCIECGSSNFKSVSEIKRHISRNHTSQLVCPVCYTGFSRKDNLMRHFGSKHPACDPMTIELRLRKAVATKYFRIYDKNNYLNPIMDIEFKCTEDVIGGVFINNNNMFDSLNLAMGAPNCYNQF